MKKNIYFALILLLSIFYTACSSSEAPNKYSEYKTKTNLTFPLRGESYIGWGGRTVEQNYHADYKDQRFAIDIVALKVGHAILSKEDVKDDNYKTYSGDELKNESYYVFGREVLSTGVGTVVATKNNVEDNIPGTYNEKEAAGNYVVIDHGNGEFSMFAHFKQGSVLVQKGDSVKTGDVLGLCGNSGNSSEAHLHYHLQNTKEWHKGESIPAQFNSYIANGKLVERGEPLRGQIVEIE